MRVFRRAVNPIFVEDEGYNWKPRRAGIGKAVLTVTVLLSLTGLILLVAG